MAIPRPHPRTVLLTAALAVAATGAALALEASPAQAASGTAATVRSSTGWLNTRSGPSTGYAAKGRLRNWASVRVACWVNGQTISGTLRRTAQWDRLTDGRYVSHAYIAPKGAIGACAPARPAAKPPAPPPKPPAPAPPPSGPTAGMSNAAFLAASIAPAQQNQRMYGVPASVTIAQAILESGWGRSKLAVNDRNLFGIKCSGNNHGPFANGCHTYVTTECTPRCRTTKATFRTYPNTAASFRDHAYFLTTNSRYRAAFNYKNNANAFLYQVWRAGYATSPTYVANVQKVMRSQNLYRFDR